MSTRPRIAAALFVATLSLIANLWILFAARTYEEHTTLCSPSYLTLGENLRAGKGFVNSVGAPESRHTPGYPLFIAAVRSVTNRYEAVIFVQHLLLVLVALALFRFVLQATGQLVVATLSASLFAIDLATLWISNQIMAEALFTAMILMASILTWRATDSTRQFSLAMLVGLIVGAAVLVKPIALLYALPLALYLTAFGRKGRFRSALVLLLCALLLPSAWILRNQREKGVATISSLAGENMLAWRAAGVWAIRSEPKFLPYAPVPLPDEEFVRRFYRYVQPGLNSMFERDLREKYGERAAQLNDAQRAVLQGEMGRRIILENPVDFFRLAIFAVLHVMLDGPWEAASSLSGLMRAPLMYLMFVSALLSAVAAVVGLIHLYRAQGRLFWLIVLCGTYFVGMTTGMEAESRFRVPFTPLYSIAIAQGILVIAARLRIARQTFRPASVQPVSDALIGNPADRRA